MCRFWFSYSTATGLTAHRCQNTANTLTSAFSTLIHPLVSCRSSYFRCDCFSPSDPTTPCGHLRQCYLVELRYQPPSAVARTNSALFPPFYRQASLVVLPANSVAVWSFTRGLKTTPYGSDASPSGYPRLCFYVYYPSAYLLDSTHPLLSIALSLYDRIPRLVFPA